MSHQLCRQVLVGVAATVFVSVALPIAADAQPKIVKAIGNAVENLGDIGKAINPSAIVPANPKPYIGKLPTGPGVVPTPPLPKAVPGGWVTPPGGQVAKLPPAPGGAATPPARPPVIYDKVLPTNPPPKFTPGVAGGGPNRPLPPIILDTPAGRVVPPLDPNGPPIKYTGVAPDNAPVRKVAPEKFTGVGGEALVKHEPNPLNVPIPVKTTPNAPVKLPGTPIASNPPARVNLPPAPVRGAPPVAKVPDLGPPPQALLALYGEDAASKALRKAPSTLKRVAKVTAGVIAGGVVVAAVGGGIYLGVECTTKDLANCPEFLKTSGATAQEGEDVVPGFKVTVENQTNGRVTIASILPDGTEKAETSPEAPGLSVTLLVAQNARLNVYKDGVFFQTYAVTTDNWTIPIR